MRQADSTIRGYLYQFNKSIYEILMLEENSSMTLEGVIEDIDIFSPTSTTTIQCKYHEDKKFQISSVASPILEMLCNYCESSCLGKTIQYILYAYFNENVDSVNKDDFIEFINTTVDKDVLIKYFHRIYTVSDATILAIANKEKKSKDDKEQLIKYYKNNRKQLTLRVDIDSFWDCFKYVRAEKYDTLKEQIISKFLEITDSETATSLYYPNAFHLVASLSSKSEINDRTITKDYLIDYLKKQQTVLINRWTIAISDRKKLFKRKKESLSSGFSSNSELRAIVLSEAFLKANEKEIITFIRDYIAKYYKKPKLQKPPIFIFDNNHDLMQRVIRELFKYQQLVNNGFVGDSFIMDSFINDLNCSRDYVCKIAALNNMSTEILERCQVNQLYLIGQIQQSFESENYIIESLDIFSVNELRYLSGLSKVLEDEL